LKEEDHLFLLLLQPSAGFLFFRFTRYYPPSTDGIMLKTNMERKKAATITANGWSKIQISH